MQPKSTAVTHSLIYPALLAGLSPIAADAAVVVVRDRPLTISNGDGYTGWDINGDSTADLQLSDYANGDPDAFELCMEYDVCTTCDGSNYCYGLPITPAMLVSSANNFCCLCCSCMTILDGTGSHYSSASYEDGMDAFLLPDGNNYGGTIGFCWSQPGPDIYGIFRFSTSGCDDSSPSTCSFTIHEWAYDDVPGTAISGDALTAVPASISSATYTALLSIALGIAGMRRRRSLKPQTQTRH